MEEHNVNYYFAHLKTLAKSSWPLTATLLQLWMYI